METILIVDDEKNYLVVLEALLAPEGFEIATSSSAVDALSLIRNSDLDLVIADMKMPMSHWFWAMCHAAQVMNCLPCEVNAELTSSFELVHGVKPDYQVLF